MTIQFSPAERELIEEQWAMLQNIVTVIARLHGLKGQQLATLQLAPDHSGLTVPDPEPEVKES